MNLEILSGKPFELSEEQIGQVRAALSSMTQDEKIAQLFVVLGDAYPHEQLHDLAARCGIGGVLFRPAPMKDVKQRFDELDRIAPRPILHCANLEEGGAGIATDGTYFGTQMQVAAAGDPEMTRLFADVCAAEGRRAGVDWTFSPVVDIDLNFRNPITNLRTFGSDADKVREHALIFANELQAMGVAAACKHFPGDGVDSRDQHLHPTYNTLSAEEWYDTYGKIYQNLIDGGILSVMAGHIVQPYVIRDINPQAGEDRMLPGSLSHELLTGVLREKFGFEGVIITDATIMGGYTMAMERARAIPTTIAAGADMICFTTDIEEDMRYMKEGLQSGILTEERLDEAVARVLALKATAARMRTGHTPADDVTPRQCRDAMSACVDRSVTLVKNKKDLIPVKPGDPYKKIRLMTVGEDDLFDGSLKETAADELKELGFEVELYDPIQDDLHGTSSLPADRLTLILANYPTASNQVTVRPAWCPKHALEIPRFVHEEAYVFISFGNPYHLQDVPRVPAFINAYAATREHVRQALRKMTGLSEFTGISPSDVFCGMPDTRL